MSASVSVRVVAVVHRGAMVVNTGRNGRLERSMGSSWVMTLAATTVVSS